MEEDKKQSGEGSLFKWDDKIIDNKMTLFSDIEMKMDIDGKTKKGDKYGFVMFKYNEKGTLDKGGVLHFRKNALDQEDVFTVDIKGQ